MKTCACCGPFRRPATPDVVERVLGEWLAGAGQELLADADTTLSDAEMEVVIDTAVVVFCPVDAQRLGITA